MFFATFGEKVYQLSHVKCDAYDQAMMFRPIIVLYCAKKT